MRLYTVQHKLALDEILNGANFYCDEKFADVDFKKAYNWLKVQMERILKCKIPTNLYPIWFHSCIQAFGFEVENQDELDNLFYFKEKDYYLLEFEIPDDMLVMSDYEKWHCVLNNSFLDKGFYKPYDEIEPFKSYSSSEIEESWKEVFNISDTDILDIQITSPFVNLHWLVKYQPVHQLCKIVQSE